MSWIRVASINLIVFFVLFSFLEIISGVSRLLLGKEYRIPFQISDDVKFSASPCVEMKTDVLLSHVPNRPESCVIKGGKTIGEYVVYGKRQDNATNILILGGSTSSGFYQHYSDGDTWPKIFSELIGDEYYVINGAVGGYSSLQELYKIVRDLPRLGNVNTVISLNGINELANYHGEDIIRSIQFPFLTDIQHTMNSQQIWIDQRFTISILEKLTPNLNSLLRYIISNKSALLIRTERRSDTERLIDNELFTTSINAADRWEANVKRMHALAEIQAVDYYVFLQPTMGLNGSQSYAPPDTPDEKILNELQEKYIEEIQSLYDKLKLRCQRIDFCFDISEIASPSGFLYSDSRHHNANGNKIIATSIYQQFLRLNR